MDNLYFYLIIILVLFNIVFFYIGQLFGSLKNINDHKTNSSFISKSKKEIGKTETIIDETKYIPKIVTNDIEIKYDSLGDSKTTSENINTSINKLKSMKGQ